MRSVHAVAVATIAVALMSTISCSSDDSSETVASATTTAAKVTTTAQPTSTTATTSAKSTTSTTTTSSATNAGAAANGTVAAAPTETWATNPLYLVNIPGDEFVKGSPNGADVKINGTSYQYSHIMRGSGGETVSNEFNVPLGYQTLDFTLGMTDKSVVNKYSDGVASLTVYVAGNAVYGPTEFKYSDSIPVRIPIDGKSRVRIDASGVDGNEYVALGSAKFSR